LALPRQHDTDGVMREVPEHVAQRVGNLATAAQDVGVEAVAKGICAGALIEMLIMVYKRERSQAGRFADTRVQTR
jgi:hypothetical protein